MVDKRKHDDERGGRGLLGSLTSAYSAGLAHGGYPGAVAGGGAPVFGRPEGDADPADDGHVAHVERVVEPETFVFRPTRPLPGQGD